MNNRRGVFALRDWDQAVIDSGLADRTPALERLAKLGVGAEELPAPSCPRSPCFAIRPAAV